MHRISNRTHRLWKQGSKPYLVEGAVENLKGEIGLTFNDSAPFAVASAGGYSTGFKVIHLPIESFSQIEIISQPNNQVCALDPDESSLGSDRADLIIKCDDYSKGLSGATDIAVSDYMSCAIAGNDVHCWGRAKFHDPNLTGTFMNPRLIAVHDDQHCFVDDIGLHCSRWAGIDTETVYAGAGQIKEMALDWRALCLIDDRGLGCFGDEEDSLVRYAPAGLQAPHSLSMSNGAACVIDSGVPVCWGEIGSASVPDGLEGIEAIELHENGVCARSSFDVRCWSRYFVNPYPEDFVPEDIDLVQDLALSKWFTCVTNLGGTSCWGSMKPGFIAADGLLNYPDKLVFGDDYGCAIEDAQVICFGDNIFDQVDVPAGAPSAD